MGKQQSRAAKEHADAEANRMAKGEATSNSKKPRKTECPLTKEEFLKVARAQILTIQGKEVAATVKEYSTGSFGFWINDKVILKVGDTEVKFQIQAQIIAVGSKPTKEE